MIRGYEGNNAFVGIGGTGARVLEGLIFLSSIGFAGKEGGNNRLKIILIDQDTNNGNANRTLSLLKAYNKITENLYSDRIGFALKFEPAINDKWFLQVIDAREENRLRNLIEGEEVLNIYRTLFTDKELSMKLNEGFRGLPTIGITTFYKTLIGSETFKKLKNELQFHNIVMVGSIFGGTGASGIPALGKELEKVAKKLNGVFLFPYFEFENYEGDESRETSIRPMKNVFMLKALYAANHYIKSKDFDYFNSIYLLGLPEEDFLKVGKYAEGGRNQENIPTFIEIYSAHAVDKLLKEQEEANSVNFNLLEDDEDEERKFALGIDIPVKDRKMKLIEGLQNLYKASYVFNILMKDTDLRSEFLRNIKVKADPSDEKAVKEFTKRYMEFFKFVNCTTLKDYQSPQSCKEPLALNSEEIENILRNSIKIARKIKDITWSGVLSVIYDSMYKPSKKRLLPF